MDGTTKTSRRAVLTAGVTGAAALAVSAVMGRGFAKAGSTGSYNGGDYLLTIAAGQQSGLFTIDASVYGPIPAHTLGIATVQSTRTDVWVTGVFVNTAANKIRVTLNKLAPVALTIGCHVAVNCSVV